MFGLSAPSQVEVMELNGVPPNQEQDGGGWFPWLPDENPIECALQRLSTITRQGDCSLRVGFHQKCVI